MINPQDFQSDDGEIAEVTGYTRLANATCVEMPSSGQFPWNYDMDAAPRGEYVTTTYTNGKGKKVEKTVYQHQKVILASPCGVVTVGRWLPNEERWEMFTKAVPPIAWMPWPTSPVLKEQVAA